MVQLGLLNDSVNNCEQFVLDKQSAIWYRHVILFVRKRKHSETSGVDISSGCVGQDFWRIGEYWHLLCS